jgi:tetratricopeptide (TPR) repeat protein
VRLGRLDAAAPLLERALAVREKALGSKHADLAEPLLGLAELHLARGKPELAVPLLERALAMDDKEENDDIRLTLAEALWRLGKDRPRARALAEEARARYERIGHEPGLERAARWLREHPDGRSGEPASARALPLRQNAW